MNPARLRTGELIGLAAAIGLLVALFLDWFRVEFPARRGGGGFVLTTGDAAVSGWGSLGWLALLLVVATLVLAGLWLFFTAGQTSPAIPVAAAMWTSAIGFFAAVAVLQRVVFAPGHTDTHLGAYLGLLFAAMLPLGALLSIRDERTGARESRAPDVELRTIPGRAQPSDG